MYLSEAKTITSDMAYELDPLLFDHLLKYLLFELCHLDDGEPKDLPNQSTCLSQDLSTFLSQIKYIAERLYCNLHNMIELKECQEVGGDLVNVCWFCESKQWFDISPFLNCFMYKLPCHVCLVCFYESSWDYFVSFSLANALWYFFISHLYLSLDNKIVTVTASVFNKM